MSKLHELKLTCQLPIEIHHERLDEEGVIEEMYSSECPLLGIASQGDTIDEARANLIEAISLTLHCYAEDNKLEQFLESRGMKKLEQLSSIGKIVGLVSDLQRAMGAETNSTEIVDVPVPMELLSQNSDSNAQNMAS